MSRDFTTKIENAVKIKMEEDHRPIFDPGDLIESPNGDLCVKIIEHIGEGRCCLVYSAKTVRDNAKVALKVYKKGPTYEGAVQREQYILELFDDACHNMGEKVFYGILTFSGAEMAKELSEYYVVLNISKSDL